MISSVKIPKLQLDFKIYLGFHYGALLELASWRTTSKYVNLCKYMHLMNLDCDQLEEKMGFVRMQN